MIMDSVNPDRNPCLKPNICNHFKTLAIEDKYLFVRCIDCKKILYLGLTKSIK